MKSIFTFLVLIALAAGGVYYYYFRTPVVVIDAPRLMSTEDYIKQNISELSPIKETVGGKFYVTKFEDNNGVATVYYEDGHNAYVADLTYFRNEESGIGVDTFVIRSDKK